MVANVFAIIDIYNDIEIFVSILAYSNLFLLFILSCPAMDGVPFMISEKFACASSDVSLSCEFFVRLPW